ncbi:flagellar biosynthesis anti-sigma factor FlgM [Granulosicoccus sp. 3-233]|uniref:flagellar biosynthesis anti-sigma factor FlgM n=1 Tax=Granulosicoccus sp. 3-233 TaxID=3417969 RepID=UPI003D357D4E
MALSKSGKAGSNVTQLDAMRKKRSTRVTSEKSSGPVAKKKQSTSSVEKSAGKAPAKKKTGPVKAKAASKVSDEATEKDKTATGAQPAESKQSTPGPRVSNRRFDTEKVERIKAAIAADEYEIDYLQVADKFIEHERYA